MPMLAGCTLHADRQAAVPPPPKPAVAPQPAPEPQLSIPQTTAQLPIAQPVNPDAIPREKPPQPSASEKPEAPQPARTARRPKPIDTSEQADEAPAAAAPAPAAEEKAPFEPILSPEQQNQLKAAIAARRLQIDDRLARAKGRVSSSDKVLIDRINSFLRLSDAAALRGDFTQADALSDRAYILAQELKIE